MPFNVGYINPISIPMILHLDTVKTQEVWFSGILNFRKAVRDKWEFCGLMDHLESLAFCPSKLTGRYPGNSRTIKLTRPLFL